MNRRAAIFAVTTVAGVVFAHAQTAKPIDQAIVIEDFPIVPTPPPGHPQRFKPSMVVNVFERNENSVLIQRSYGLTARAWAASNAVAAIHSFKRLTTWPGRRIVEIVSDSGDSSRIYTLSTNGTFRSVTSTINGKRTESGVLLQYRNVLWARPNRIVPGELDPWAFFWVRKSGTLCNFPDEGECQE
jgi:hypothetical protein